MEEQSKVYKAGIDIGSTTVKLVILDEQDRMLFGEYRRHHARTQQTLAQLLTEAREQLGSCGLRTQVTGSGSINLGKAMGIGFRQEVVAVADALQKTAPQTDVAIELVNPKSKWNYRTVCAGIVDAFDRLPVDEGLKKPRVGIVGEILVKYMPLANNHLVELLEREGAEAVVPNLMDFLNYSLYNGTYKHEFLGAPSDWVARAGVRLIRLIRLPALKALENSRRFEAPMPIEAVAELAKPFLSVGNQYGEGWFLTGEMAELILSGVPNIVCIQPFACLPNHVVGKGVIKALKKEYPQANIVAVDYDPGASEVNQLNRIKLMLSGAKELQPV